MNILILGSGGREHALCQKIVQSPKTTHVYVAPGNAGTAKIAENILINITDFQAVKQCVLQRNITMVIVGPEAPLVQGIHDFFLKDEALKHIPVIGPQKEAAQLEGSKAFAKAFMSRHHIPTAAYNSFNKENITAGFAFLETLRPPYVLKADGLAAGKGVLIINTMDEAKTQLENILLHHKFGTAGANVVIEEFLDGTELSCFVLTDGKNYKILPTAKDYKRIGEGDTGLNTGGMGAISPVPFADKALMRKIEDRIVKPTIQGLREEQLPYRGFIFIGLMKVGNDPYVIEYNVRMGDPEAEVVLPRIQNDMVSLFEAVANQTLETMTLEVDPRTAATVMLVSGGYPENYEKGKEITGLEALDESLVFHAGTTLKNGKLLTNGGRVLAITSYGANFRSALTTSYQNIKKIHFDGMYYRNDIGFDL
ncbi:MAG: phosphoribosylamine--glycine ligase [Bacteroidota bacterium]